MSKVLMVKKINDVLEVVFNKGFDAGRDVGSRRYELFELFNKGTDIDVILDLIKEETMKSYKLGVEDALVDIGTLSASEITKRTERLIRLQAESEDK